MSFYSEKDIDEKNKSAVHKLYDFTQTSCVASCISNQLAELYGQKYEIIFYINSVIDDFREIHGTLEDIIAAPERVKKMLNNFASYTYVGDIVKEIHKKEVADLTDIVNDFCYLLTEALEEK